MSFVIVSVLLSTQMIRTDAGSKLRGLVDGPTVCFEVDGADPVTRSGWSVMVKGPAIELTTGSDLADAAQLPLEYWARGEKSHWIRIDATSGKRWAARFGYSDAS